MPGIYIYTAIAAFLFGTAAGLVTGMQFHDAVIAVIFIVLVCFMRPLRRNVIIVCLLVASFFVTGIVRAHTFAAGHQSLLVSQAGQEISVEGVIDDEPDRRENLTIYRVRELTTGERMRVFLAHYPAYRYEDHLRLEGLLELPENFESERGIEFNYVAFLAKDDIFTTMYLPDIELVSGAGLSVRRTLFSLKRHLINNMQRWLPSPHAPLAAGLVLGAKQGLGKELLEDFRIVGLIHIVVLSGYNVTIIAQTFKRMLGFLPRTIAFCGSLTSIALFAVMTGASSTIIRASVMAAIVLIAEYAGRQYAVNRALFLAAAVMVWINPRILLHDPGFQLSFVATFALIHLGGRLSKILRFLPERFGIREIAAATLATQIAVFPMLASMTGEISIVSLVVNMLVLPTVPLAMLAGFVPSLIFFDAPLLGALASAPAYALLSYEIWIVEIFAKLPFATIGF